MSTASSQKEEVRGLAKKPHPIPASANGANSIPGTHPHLDGHDLPLPDPEFERLIMVHLRQSIVTSRSYHIDTWRSAVRAMYAHAALQTDDLLESELVISAAVDHIITHPERVQALLSAPALKVWLFEVVNHIIAEQLHLENPDILLAHASDHDPHHSHPQGGIDHPQDHDHVPEAPHVAHDHSRSEF